MEVTYMEYINDISRRDRLYDAYNIASFFDIDIKEGLELVEFHKNEIMFREGDPQRYLYFMVGGKIKVNVTQENGKSRLICFVEDFEIIDIIVLLAESDYSTHVIAMERVCCLALDLQVYKNRILNDLKFLQYASKKLAKVVLVNNNITSFNLLYPLETRLATYIVLKSGEMKFQENMTTVAELLGTSYRHLQRILSKFCDQGILKRETNCYKIIEFDHLKEISNQTIKEL